MKTSNLRLIRSFYNAYRSVIILILVPLLASPLLSFRDYDKEMKCLFVVILMATFWMFETLPVAITSLIPMVLYPAFGIMKAHDVAHTYFPETSFLFLGGLMVAIAVERSGLHERVALFVLKICGSRPALIMAGFMLVTSVLSMFISNSATTTLMIPIVNSVITALGQNQRLIELCSLTEQANSENRRRSLEGRRLSMSHEHYHLTSSTRTSDEAKIAKALMLSIAFAANIGGCGTITGTATNLVLIGQLEKLYPNADTGINFLSWMVFALPLVVLVVIAAHIILYLTFLRKCKKGSSMLKRRLEESYRSLKPVSFGEIVTGICFVGVVLLWICRDPHFFPGYSEFFEKGYISDATAVLAVVILLFVLPAEKPKCCAPQMTQGLITINPEFVVRPAILDWDIVQKQFPWAIFFLLGGGFALAAGVKESNLSELIGQRMLTMAVFPEYINLILINVLTLSLTNVCSNTVVASIFLPIVSELARSLHINPLTFMLPVALSSSFAFLLPVATPPNAMIHGTGIVKSSDMAKAGIFLTFASLGITLFLMSTWGVQCFNLSEFPLWAEEHAFNVTTIVQGH